MPESERLATFAQTKATLAIHLSIHVIEKVVEELLPAYGSKCPVAVVWRASWPDERVLKGTLATITAMVKAEKLERTALILVGPALAASGFRDSALYSTDYDRRFRPSAREQGQ
jgi:precorrin-4/cobalt-precorrin-4 C11-methyltransferase